MEKECVVQLNNGVADDLITAIGRFILKCRLDELSQLFNIFKVNMNVVGPWLERKEIASL